MGLLMNSTYRGSATLVLIVLALAAVAVGALSPENRNKLDTVMKAKCPMCYSVQTLLDKSKCKADNRCAEIYNCKPINCEVAGREMNVCYEQFTDIFTKFACKTGNSGSFGKFDLKKF